MKIKTELEIDSIAINYANKVSDPSLPDWHIRYSTYKQGYAQAQQDLLASASEGFEEWLASESYKVSDPAVLTEKVKNQMNLVWQACSLSHTKKMQEKDAEIEKLKKENQEMREALKWALSTLPHTSINKDDYTKVIDLQNKFNLSETPNSSKEGV